MGSLTAAEERAVSSLEDERLYHHRDLRLLYEAVESLMPCKFYVKRKRRHMTRAKVKHASAFDHVWVSMTYLPHRRGERVRVLGTAENAVGYLRIQFADGWVLPCCDPTHIERREGMGAR